MTYKRITTSSAATRQLGATIGKNLRGGEVIELVGDLGAGKTTLTQGVLAGLGFGDEVTSPTFTVARAYPVRDNLTVHHFDLYRMQGHDIASDEFAEIAGQFDSIAIIEWPGEGAVVLPEKRLRVTLEPQVDAADRTVTVEATDPELAYVLKGLTDDTRA